jgi:FkbM family methyltransferase
MYNNTNDVTRWFRDGGDRKRLEYNLNSDSVVVDLGGFQGSFANDVYKRFGCTVYVYEPVSAFYQRCLASNAKNEKVVVFNLGITGTTNGVVDISIEGDASSTFKTGTKTERIRVVPVASLFDGTGLTLKHIDLLKINVEGGEFEILPALIDSGYISQIENVQVQFHNFVPDAEQKRNTIRENLAKTHTLTYDYPFVWENWQLKK